jgi:hypothetical protein
MEPSKGNQLPGGVIDEGQKMVCGGTGFRPLSLRHCGVSGESAPLIPLPGPVENATGPVFMPIFSDLRQEGTGKYGDFMQVCGLQLSWGMISLSSTISPHLPDAEQNENRTFKNNKEVPLWNGN